MKTVVHTKRSKDQLLHVEAEGCIVNIRIGLTNMDGQEVTSVEIIPDNYCGERWTLEGAINNRIIKQQEDRNDA